MMNQDAARLLNALAVSDPAYEALASEYREAFPDLCGGAAIPEALPAEALALFRSDPDAAAKLDGYEAKLAQIKTFGGADLLTPQFLLSVLVLLSVYGGIEYKDKKWKLRVGFKPLDAKVLKPVLSLLAAIFGKAGKGLEELSEAIGGEDAPSEE